jgi:hypothetical protein
MKEDKMIIETVLHEWQKHIVETTEPAEIKKQKMIDIRDNRKNQNENG